MDIKVRLVGCFRVGRFVEEARQYRIGTSIREVVDCLELPEQVLGIVLVNGVHAGLENRLQDGDCLTILPILGGG